jgi:hypothetical protein
MKQLLQVQSNPFFYQDSQDEFTLVAMLELIVIYTDGKNYTVKDRELTSTPKISETRMVVDTESLQNLITDLQLHLKMLEGYRSNATQLNSLIRHVSEPTKGPEQ